MSEQVGARLLIFGRVQGVFFRAETQKAASRCGVVGWVKNRSDGTVEALAEGLQKDVKALITWCQKGPPMARVDRVDVTWKTYSGAFSRFDINY